MTKKRSYTLEELAEITQSELVGTPDFQITGVDELETAGPSDLSFLANPKYREAAKKSKAGALCIDQTTPLVESRNYLISEKPSETFQKIISLFIPDRTVSGFKGIHPTAVIHQSAKVSKDAVIGPYVVIDRDVIVGARCKISSHVSIGPEVEIGDDCILHPHVTVREGCKLGNRVILQPGVVLGGCGYGYVTDEKGRHKKITHYGVVVLEDDVEIGANTTIDRARFKATRVKRGSKIDNLVMIGHNVTVGEDNLIISQTGLSGSIKTGRNVIMAGQVGVAGHIEIGDGVILMARSGVSKSVLERGAYGGAPVVPAKDWHKQQIHLQRLHEYALRLKKLEEKLAKEESTC